MSSSPMNCSGKPALAAVNPPILSMRLGVVWVASQPGADCGWYWKVGGAEHVCDEGCRQEKLTDSRWVASQPTDPRIEKHRPVGRAVDAHLPVREHTTEGEI